MIKRLLIVFLYATVFVSGYSQVQKFDTDISTFLPQMEERFKASNGKNSGKEFPEKIVQFWNSPDTPDDIKKLIIETCNLFAVKRARPYPDYETYLTTVISFYTSGHNDNSFNAWHEYLTDLLKTPRYPLRKIVQQMRLTKGLIENNEIFSAPSVKWKCTTDDYKYHYSEGKLTISVGKTDIMCIAKKDSIKVFDTQGVFYPGTQVWQGDRGRITWERSGFDADKVYAVFGRYKIDMKKSYFNIDTVDFYNKHYFDYALKGSLTHKVMVIHDPKNSLYPQFHSFEQQFRIENIYPNMNYEGGFSQNGAKFLGSGTNKNLASITIYRNDTLFITARSLYFALRNDHIISNNTEISIKLDSGFIYHPGLQFKYMAKSNEMLLIRNGEGMSQSPYFDTYHKISMDVELIRWKLDEPWMDLKMITGSAENIAFFESLSYFREDFFNSLQGMDANHPLLQLKKCSQYFGGQPFSAKDYASFTGLPEAQVRRQVMKLSFYGFIGYNVNNDEIEVRDHLNDYLEFRMGKKDYDVIRFNSTTPANVPNARFDLNNFDLNINGVSAISICDHQNVVFFPSDEKIILKQNRNFRFDGAINAGMLNLFGNGFKFSYEDFKIDMKNIDSLKMKVETGEVDYYGLPVTHFVENTINNLSGSLLIDEPDNKSGKKRNYQYPILISKTKSMVHFNNPEVKNGIYDAKDFYFTLEPFQMDSVNTLKKENFNFKGTFVSSIFPDITENLKIREDYSLGFSIKTPPEGFSIYGGKALFTDNIELDNKGLSGKGTLKYLTSTSVSDKFLFLPDKISGLASSFTLKPQTEGVLYPDIQAKYISIDYYPLKDEFYARSHEEYFTMFNSEGQLNGNLKITPKGITGDGILYMLRASLNAPIMTFGNHTVLADSSSFKLVGEEEEAISFSTSDLISSDVDFEKREGVFTSLGAGEPVEFAENKFMSIITKFSWDMDLNKIFLGAHGSKGNLFISTHKKQDSLQFYVPLAEYDMEKKLIIAEEVKNIDVADARIKLKNGLVIIREDAVLDPLDSTTIEIGDSATFTHRIYDARVNITGRYAYNGTGNYKFVNGDNETYTIAFHNIEATKDTKTTVAEGIIDDNSPFTFNSHFAYKGKVHFNAKEKFLTFDGGVKMLHDCGRNGPQAFMRFNSAVDPQNVVIPVSEKIENYDHEGLYASFFLTKDTTRLYSTFLEGRENYSDIPVLTGKGYLTYNEKKSSFEIASREKIENPDTAGTLMRFSTEECRVTGEGVIDLGIPLGQVLTRTSGTITDDRTRNEITLTTMLGIDFYFDENATNILYSSLINSRARSSKISSEDFIERVSEWTGTKEAENIDKKRFRMGDADVLPKNMSNVFTFGNINFKWNKRKRAYVADGKADLSFIKNFSVNLEVNVKAEITRSRGGNSLELLVEADKNTWFFFSYKNGIMYTLSSIPDYNDYIKKTETATRKKKIKAGEKSFVYMISPESKKTRFLNGLRGTKVRTSNPLYREGPDASDTSAIMK